MAFRYEEELHIYQDVIDGAKELPEEASRWRAVRLPLEGRPKFLGLLSSPQHRLYCIVQLGTFMGEGNVRIPLGLYGERHDPADKAVVSHNRLQLNYHGNESLEAVSSRLGLPWHKVEDIRVSSGGGLEIFTTLGYELYLHRSLSTIDATRRIILPDSDDILHALSSHGLTQHIHDVLENIRIDPIAPPELQLTTS